MKTEIPSKSKTAMVKERQRTLSVSDPGVPASRKPGGTTMDSGTGSEPGECDAGPIDEGFGPSALPRTARGIGNCGDPDELGRTQTATVLFNGGHKVKDVLTGKEVPVTTKGGNTLATLQVAAGTDAVLVTERHACPHIRARVYPNVPDWMRTTLRSRKSTRDCILCNPPQFRCAFAGSAPAEAICPASDKTCIK